MLPFDPHAIMVCFDAGHVEIESASAQSQLATVLLQALLQVLQRLIHATPHAVVAMNAALAPESDATLATLREACDGACGVVDDVRRTAVSLAGDVRARCGAVTASC